MDSTKLEAFYPQYQFSSNLIVSYGQYNDFYNLKDDFLNANSNYLLGLSGIIFYMYYDPIFYFELDASFSSSSQFSLIFYG